MSIGKLLLFVAILVIWLVYLFTESVKTGNDDPNVLVISIDTLRPDHLSCYGYDKVTSPHIDALAKVGHQFTNAFTSMPTTLPAHTSLFTSLYPTQLAVRRNGEIIPAEVVTLAEILREQGYSTAAFVSATVLHSYFRLNQGFLAYFDGDVKRGSRPASEILGDVSRWMRYFRKEPFFLWVHLFDPHTPYYAPQEYRDHFGAPDGPVLTEFGFVKNPEMFTDDVVGQVVAAYDAEIAYADWAVGQLMDAIKLLGMDKRTLVVIVSDHGESLDELKSRYGYAFDHGEFLYAHQLRIPLIMRMPQKFEEFSSPMVHESPVSIVDVMPTILDLLGIEPRKQPMVGRSLVPLLAQQPFEDRPVFTQRRFFEEAVRDFLGEEEYSIIKGDLHLIQSTRRGNELYNLANDPAEFTNLVDQDDTVAALMNELKTHVFETTPLFGDPEFGSVPEVNEALKNLGYTK